MEPNRKVRKQGLEHFIKFVRELPCPSPQAMFSGLQEYGYRGQDHARRALCLMAYRHVRRIKRIYLDGVDRVELPRKSNFLFVGPTGLNFATSVNRRQPTSLPMASSTAPSVVG